MNVNLVLVFVHMIHIVQMDGHQESNFHAHVIQARFPPQHQPSPLVITSSSLSGLTAFCNHPSGKPDQHHQKPQNHLHLQIPKS